MSISQLYLPTVIPQWGIFAGVVLITIGYVDKKNILTRIGWITLVATGLTALYFNLFGGLEVYAQKSETNYYASHLIATGWQASAGVLLAIVSLLMFHFKSKRYTLLSVLAIIYFILTFFLYLQISDKSEIKIKADPKTEQKL